MDTVNVFSKNATTAYLTSTRKLRALTSWRRFATVPIVAVLALLSTATNCRQGLSSYDPGKYFDQAQQSHAHIKSVVIEGKVIREEQGNIINGNIRMMTDLEGRLRVDIISPFDQPMGILIANDTAFQYFDYAQNALFVGQPDPCTLAQFLSVSLMPHDVLPLLTGLPPLVGQAYHLSDQSSGKSGDNRATMTAHGSQGERQTLVLKWVGSEWVTSSSEIDAPIATSSKTTELFPVLRVSYKDYLYIGKTPLPQSIAVSEPINKRSLSILIKHQDINVNIPASSFAFRPPSNASKKDITCDTQTATPDADAATTDTTDATATDVAPPAKDVISE